MVGSWGGWTRLPLGNFGPAVIRGRLGLGGSWGLWGDPLVPVGCLLPSASLLLCFCFARALLLLCFCFAVALFLLCFCFALVFAFALLLCLLCFCLVFFVYCSCLCVVCVLLFVPCRGCSCCRVMLLRVVFLSSYGRTYCC